MKNALIQVSMNMVCIYTLIIGSSGLLRAMESDQSIIVDASLEHENTEEYFQGKIMAYRGAGYGGGYSPTPLHRAAASGDMPFLKELLRRNTVPIDDDTGWNFWTPLHCAVENGNVEAVHLLLSHGANPEPPIDGMCAVVIGLEHCPSPIELAKEKENAEILDLLLTARDGGTSLHRAVRNENRAEVESLLSNNDGLLARDNQNRTPFEVAIENGNIGIVELFLERGVDFKACTYRGSPLHNALWTGNIPLIELILKCCPEQFLTLRDCNGYRPLHIASRRGLLPIAITLIEHGAEVNAENNHGRTALDIAIFRKHRTVVDYLLSVVAAKGNYLKKEDLEKWQDHTFEGRYY